MKTFYLVRRVEASAIGLRDRITRLVITEEIEDAELVDSVEAESYKDAKRLLGLEMTPQQKDFADALRVYL